MIAKIPKIWSDKCYIIGGGPSLMDTFNIPVNLRKGIVNKTMPLSCLEPFLMQILSERCIGVNNSAFISLLVDVLFFSDYKWWQWHKTTIRDFKGLKYTMRNQMSNYPKECDLQNIKICDTYKSRGLANTPNKICWNNNSGASSINLATQLGAKRIFLIGFDMNVCEETNWHGKHPDAKDYNLKSVMSKKAGGKTFEEYLKSKYHRHMSPFKAIKRDADSLGIEIYNLNADSKIKQFPFITLNDSLDM